MRKANNMYIFPGLALGAHLGKTGTVTDMMIQTSAEALPELITPEDLRLGYVFPRLSDARYALTLVAAPRIPHRHMLLHTPSTETGQFGLTVLVQSRTKHT